MLQTRSRNCCFLLLDGFGFPVAGSHSTRGASQSTTRSKRSRQRLEIRPFRRAPATAPPASTTHSRVDGGRVGRRRRSKTTSRKAAKKKTRRCGSPTGTTIRSHRRGRPSRRWRASDERRQTLRSRHHGRRRPGRNGGRHCRPFAGRRREAGTSGALFYFLAFCSNDGVVALVYPTRFGSGIRRIPLRKQRQDCTNNAILR